jgi:hypothetical protein
MQQDGRGHIPTEEEKLAEDVRRLKIIKGHKEAKPGETEDQKHPAPFGVGAEQKDESSHAELTQRHEEWQPKLHRQPPPGSVLYWHCDLVPGLPAPETVR